MENDPNEFNLEASEQRLILEVFGFLESCLRSGHSRTWSFDLVALWPEISILRDALRSSQGQ